jgi:hypothetical protein
VDLTLLAVGSWSEAEVTLEDAREVALVREAALYSDVSKGHIRRFEQMACFLDALAQNKLVWALSRCLTEQTGEMVGTEANLLSQCL